MSDELAEKAAQAVIEGSNPSPKTFRDLFKLVFNKDGNYSAIAIHAGMNKNFLYYDAENLAAVAATQVGQSVTLGHLLDAGVYSVGTVTHAEFNEKGDEFGPYIDVRFVIQNHPQIVEAIEEGKLTEVSTTTNYSQAWCTICGAEYDTCPHIIGKEYDGKIAGMKLNVINLGPLALVDAGADVKSTIYNEFIRPKEFRIELEKVRAELNELKEKVDRKTEPPKKKPQLDTGKALNVPSADVSRVTLADILPPRTLKRRIEKKGDRVIYWNERE